jgi:RNA polymerase sigma factor (sigma-70 family)
METTQSPDRLSPQVAARLDSLFREYNAFVVRLAAAQLHDDDRAQDIAQTVWLGLIPQLRDGVTIANPRSYLAACVRHRVIDRQRLKSTSEEPADWSDALTARALPPAPPADVDALAFAELSTPQAAVLKLTSQGLSQSAIAHRLGKSRQAVQQNQHRGARNLRRLMAA